ncbi:zinc finger protein 534-like isoform X1 [Lucilia cuprina]|uniref:zinc finger protein 534-like isoform X1 n=2 Tax=Lucilia cuprina TaxID=7375 RepID=UPI001F05A324|nr:zinc finger protein 534-like isoform X1 [Lucilia cuprina]
MSSATSCRLCSFSCEGFKNLYEDNGQKSEVYEVAVKYFNSLLLNSGAETSTPSVICLDCWQHISDFHSFQQWILNAQIEQEDVKLVVHEDEQSVLETDDLMSSIDIIEFDITDTRSKTKSNGSFKSDDIEYKGEFYSKDDDDTIIAKLKGMLECYKCKDLFSSFSTLEIHFEQLHPLEQSCVVCCGEIFDVKWRLVEHLVVAHNKIDVNPFKCGTCSASFSQYGNLRRHVRKKHAVQPLLKWTCRYCNKLFRNHLHLERHKHKIHASQEKKDFPKKLSQTVNKIKKRKYSEDYDVDCEPEKISLVNTETKENQMYIKEETIDIKHIEINLPSTSIDFNSTVQIQMPALDIIDVKKENLTDSEIEEDSINKKSYSNIKEEPNLPSTKFKSNLKCPKCNITVKSYDQLNGHFNIQHPEERCYINCCDITLYEQASIVEHLQFHENPKRFKCNDCGKCFKNSKGLASHKLQVHADNRSVYHLHFCYCKRAKELQKENKQQQIGYDTSVCCQRKKKILEDDALIAKWKKVLICEICKTTFPYYSLMRMHFYHNHPGEKCYISCCQRKISRISDALDHIRSHLDPNVYRCKICNTICSSKSCLAKHMRNAHNDYLPKHKWACDECDKTFEIRQILTRHKNSFHSKQV